MAGQVLTYLRSCLNGLHSSERGCHTAGPVLTCRSRASLHVKPVLVLKFFFLGEGEYLSRRRNKKNI